jgi:hypothetical protein
LWQCWPTGLKSAARRESRSLAETITLCVAARGRGAIDATLSRFFTQDAEVGGLERDARGHKPPKFEADGARFLVERIGGKNMRPALLATVEKPDTAKRLALRAWREGLSSHQAAMRTDCVSDIIFCAALCQLPWSF